MDDKIYPQRTLTQNKALHKFYQLLADELNDAGLDQRKVLKPSVDIPWTRQAVKEQIWRPVQEAQLGKRSTTELTTTEIDQVFDTITRHLGEKFGISIQFPSIQELMLKETI